MKRRPIETIRPEILEIVITVEGGIIQSIDNIPEGAEIVTLDFDTEGAPSEDIVKRVL